MAKANIGLMIRSIFVVVFALCWAMPAMAWNSFGHMEVAAAAWSHLTPQTRVRVGELLKLNSMYESWTNEVPAEDRARVAFIIASTWADVIKGAPEYVTDGSASGNRPPLGPQASQNIGYADHFRHKYWHFVDIPFSPDGTALEEPVAPNIQTQIAAFRAALSASDLSDDVKSYDLVWLIHLVGDAHQPLHTTSRFTRSLPHGDDGGNAIRIRCGSGCSDPNLHAFWDDVLGPRTASISTIAEAADRLPPAPPELASVTDEKAWLRESFELAQSTFYAPPIGEETGPFALTDGYKANALDVAKRRIALAGIRLAAVLNAAMSDSNR